MRVLHITKKTELFQVRENYAYNIMLKCEKITHQGLKPCLKMKCKYIGRRLANFKWILFNFLIQEDRSCMVDGRYNYFYVSIEK